MGNKEPIIILAILFGIIILLIVPSIPFTESQFYKQVTDLNYSKVQEGDYNTRLLIFDGNKLTVIDVNDLNVALPDLSVYVPYVGANKDVNIGGYDYFGERAIMSLDSTDYINTNGANSIFYMKNPNINGQNVVYSEINGNMVAKWRTDYVGNNSWVTGATGNYDFFTGGDYLTGTTKLHINNDGKIGVGAGNSVPSDDFHVKTTTTQTTPQIFIEQDGAGDAAIEMGIVGDSWIWGIDNSDSDYLKLAYSSTQGGGALGTNDKWKINTGGSLAIGGVAPSAIIHTYTKGTGVATIHGRFENASTEGRAQFIVSSGSYPENFFALMTHGQSLSTAHNYYATAIPGTKSDAGKGILLGQGTRMSQFLVGTYNDKPMGFFTNNTLRMSMDSSYGIKVFDNVNMVKDLNVDGKIVVDGNIWMTSPNGTQWNCGVSNTGVFSCS